MQFLQRRCGVDIQSIQLEPNKIKSLQEFDDIADLPKLILQFLVLCLFEGELFFFLIIAFLLRIETASKEALLTDLNRQPLSSPLEQLDLPPKERVVQVFRPDPLGSCIQYIALAFNTTHKTEPRLHFRGVSGSLLPPLGRSINQGFVKGQLLKVLLVLFIIVLQLFRSQKILIRIRIQQAILLEWIVVRWECGYILSSMKRVLSMARRSLKVAGYSAIGFSIAGFAYLQYINSIIGPVRIQKEEAISFYKKDMKMSEGESERTYYWLLFRISLSRVLRFHSYRSTCSQFLSKIVEPNLRNYKTANLIEEIDSVPQIRNDRQNRKLFARVSQVRKGSTETLEVRAYIIKQLRELQKLLHSYRIIGIPPSRQEEISKIYRYLCEAGCVFKDPDIIKYVAKLPELELKFPNDELHKIIFI